MNNVCLGIIGINMGKFHADYLLNKKVQRCELTAVSDAFPANPRTTGNSAPSTK